MAPPTDTLGPPLIACPAAWLVACDLPLAVVDLDLRPVFETDAFGRLVGPDPRPGTATPLTHRMPGVTGAVRDLLTAEGADPTGEPVEWDLEDGRRMRLRIAAAGPDRRCVTGEVIAPAGAREHRNPPESADPVTGLPGRSTADHVLAGLAADGGDPVAALVVGVDRFRHVNETLGHHTGDEVLRLAARRILAAIRDEDLAVRLAGDEFLVVQRSGPQPESAETAARRLIDVLGRPFLVRGQQVNVGASVGIALHGDGDRIDDLLPRADLALRAAKAGGGNRLHLFETSMARRAEERRALELHLRRALAMGELALVYQPQMNLTRGGVTGFEALLRWNSADRGPISPAEFIPVAEELGIITEIGAWVLRTACAEAARWPGDLSVAVNVSPVQFEADDIVETVRHAIERAGIAPERLEIEITEGVMLRNSDAVLRRLHAIRDLGVRISMDDFGTGYSSLSCLNGFPFSKIKIDQSFVRSPESERTGALVRAILRMGESLGMETLAEGVETGEQLARLTAEGCGQVQGYLISRPLPPEGIDAFLHETVHGHVEEAG